MVAGRFLLRSVADKIDDQGVLGAKDSIRIEVFVPFDSQVRRDRHEGFC